MNVQTPADRWYYAKDRTKLGPVPLARLRDLLAAGTLMASDMVLQEDTQKWRPLAEVAAATAPIRKRWPLVLAGGAALAMFISCLGCSLVAWLSGWVGSRGDVPAVAVAVPGGKGAPSVPVPEKAGKETALRGNPETPAAGPQEPKAPPDPEPAPDSPRQRPNLVPQVGHSQSVTALAVSPDGKLLLTGSKDQTARLWDVASGMEIRAFQGHDKAVSLVLFSPDGNEVLTASNSDRTVLLWDVESGEQKRIFVGLAVTAVAFSPDGKRLLTASSTHAAQLRDAESGKEIRVLDGHTGNVTCVAFSTDGKALVTGSEDATARLWDAESGKEIRTFRGHAGSVTAVALSADARQVLTGSRDKTARLWDAPTGNEVRAFSGHTNDLSAVAFAPGGKHVLTGSHDRTARLWDAASGKEIRAYLGHTMAVSMLAFTSGGKELFTGNPDSITGKTGDARVRLWDAGSREKSLIFQSDRMGPVTAVAYSPDGTQVLTGSGDKAARLWDAVTGEEIRAFEGHGASVTSVVFSTDGKQVLTGSDDATARLWDATSGKEIRTFKGHARTITSVAMSRDGKQVLTGSQDNTARLWDAASGKEIRAFEERPKYTGPKLKIDVLRGTVHSVAFSPDGKQVLTGTGKVLQNVASNALLWDAASGELIRTFTGFGEAVAFSRDGKRVLAGGRGSTWLWDVASGKYIRSFQGHTATITAVAFSPDGTQILTGSQDRTARLWDVANGSEMRAFAHALEVSAVAFSPDGKTVLTGSKDRTAQMWQVGPGQERILAFEGGQIDRVAAVASSPDGKRLLVSSGGVARVWSMDTGKVLYTLTGHDGGVTSIAFSTDGKHILTGSDDATARLWNADNGKEIRAFRGHDRSVLAVALSRDGQQVLTGSADKSARLWDVASGNEIRAFRGSPLITDANYLGEVASVALSPDGKTVLTGSGGVNKEYRAWLWDAGNGRVLRVLRGHTSSITAVAFSLDGAHALTGSWDRTVRVWQVATGNQVRSLPQGPVTSLAVSADGTKVLAGAWDNTARMWDPAGGKLILALEGNTYRVSAVAFSGDGKYLITGGWDGIVRMYDAAGRERCRLIGFRDGNWAVFTPEHDYMASRGALSGVGFSVGKRIFPFDQFDLKFNRPDKVLERIGLSSPEIIAAYRRAYQKRLKRMNFTEDQLSGDFHVPTLAVSATAGLTTPARTLTLKVRATDSRYLLDRLVIDINGVPVQGSAGISLRQPPMKASQQEIEIELSAGKNKIAVSVLNEKGAESLRETVSITCDAPPRKPHLYVVAVGVSDYQDERFRLTYADKDARDLAELLDSKRDRFGEVKVLRILNRHATRENILKAKDFLKASQVDDLAVVFFAGHGLLDKNLDYYFATADLDFKDPAKRGLPYEAIEDLLDGIRARKKLLLMDTCHSGELDKEDVQVTRSDKKPDDAIKVRSFRGLDLDIVPKVGLGNSVQLLQTMFADLRRGTGAVVISSAGGAEYAMESATWQNGVFTHALLRGLKGEADRNKDGRVQVSELRHFVEQEVSRLTQGRQTPTARRENLAVDFTLD